VGAVVGCEGVWETLVYHPRRYRMNSPDTVPASSEPSEPRIESLSAITLATGDMARAVSFYEALGFPIRFGGPQEAFTSSRSAIPI
jgi:catechol-2,3-dioxygenase